jgi:WS/DGAT/MGAT family acyltransferase
MQLAVDAAAGPAQVAAVLVLDGALDAGAVVDALAARVRGVPPLRRRLVRAPRGCGRPLWVDDPAFDVRRHLRTLQCPAPGDEAALLAVTAAAATARLPRDRPLWAATLVTGLGGGRAALVLVVHHALLDGAGGLAALTLLVDGNTAAGSAEPGYPRPAPPRRVLFADSLARRARAVARVPHRLRRLRDAVAELRSARVPRVPRTSLNRPTGPRRDLALVRADLAATRAAAHAHHATVNDAILAAAAGALATLVRARGEDVPPTVVVSVPVAARRAGSGTGGNAVGVLPVPVPTDGAPTTRLDVVARATAGRYGAARGASAGVIAPLYRLAAAAGVLRRFLDHQHLVNTFVTDLTGPARRLSFLGVPVAEVFAVPSITGNITVAFAALSYAGALTITLVADPDTCPDLPALAAAVQSELDTLTGRVGSAGPG